MNVERWCIKYEDEIKFVGAMMIICTGASIAGWVGWWAVWSSFLTLVGGLTVGYQSGAKDAE